MLKSKYLHGITIDHAQFDTRLIYNTNTNHITITTVKYYPDLIYAKSYRESNKTKSKYTILSRKSCKVCGCILLRYQRKYCNECKRGVHLNQMKDNYKINKSEWLSDNGKYHDELLERNRNNAYKHNIRPHLMPINQCIQLNSRFQGSEGHHIMSNVIIFIPKDIHRSIDHRFPKPNQNGLNMKKINALAINYLINLNNILKYHKI